MVAATFLLEVDIDVEVWRREVGTGQARASSRTGFNLRRPVDTFGAVLGRVKELGVDVFVMSVNLDLDLTSLGLARHSTKSDGKSSSSERNYFDGRKRMQRGRVEAIWEARVHLSPCGLQVTFVARNIHVISTWALPIHTENVPMIMTDKR